MVLADWCILAAPAFIHVVASVQQKIRGTPPCQTKIKAGNITGDGGGDGAYYTLDSSKPFGGHAGLL